MNRNSSFRLSLLDSVNNAKITYMKNAARIILLGASALLLTSCGNKKQSSLPSFDYSSFCMADSPFAFEAGTTLSSLESNFTAIRLNYSLTTDKSVNSTKTYFTLKNGIYSKVSNPQTANIATYYEKGDLSGISAIFSAAATADIYPNKMVYSYLDKVDYGTANVLDWYKDPKTFDRIITRSKELKRYQSSDSLLIDGTVSYAEDSFQDFNHEGTQEIVNQSKSGVFQLVRDGYCDYTNKIFASYQFNAAVKKIGGVSSTVEPSTYNYYLSHSYSHDLYQSNLALTSSEEEGNNFLSFLARISDYDDVSAVAFPTGDGSYFSFNATGTDDSGTKGIKVSFKALKTSTDTKSTADPADDEISRYGLEYTFITKGGSVLSSSNREYTSSQIGSGTERILTDIKEEKAFSFDSTLSSFSGNKIVYNDFKVGTSEDFAF
jgi:hypothetical protein